MTSARTQLQLGQAYLATKHYLEAYLLAQDIERLNQTAPLPPEVITQSLLLKTQACVGLKRFSEAQKWLKFLENKISQKDKPAIQAQVKVYQLIFKLKDCRSRSEPKGLQTFHFDSHFENQVRTQMQQQGLCLLEAFNHFHEILSLGDQESALKGGDLVSEAIKSYSQSCFHPKVPSSSHGQLTVTHQRFMRELEDLLQNICRSQLQTALDFLDSWMPKIPLTSKKAGEKVYQTLKNLIPKIVSF